MIPRVGDRIRFNMRHENLVDFGTEGIVETVNGSVFKVRYPNVVWTHSENYEGVNWCLVNNEKSYQTDVPYAFDLVPAKALLKVASIFKEGAKKYGKDSWRGHVSLSDNVNHSIGHQYMHLSGDVTEEHLANAACRSLMALELYLELDDVKTP